MIRKADINETAVLEELANVRSLQFHLKVGVEEANRITCFIKRL